MRKNKLIALIGTLTMAAAGLAAVSAGVSKPNRALETNAVAQTNSSIRICAIDEQGWAVNKITIWDSSTFESGYTLAMLGEDLIKLGYTVYSGTAGTNGCIYNMKSTDSIWGSTTYDIIIPWYCTKLSYTVRNDTESASKWFESNRGVEKYAQWKNDSTWYDTNNKTDYTYAWSQASVTLTSNTGGSATFTPYNSSAQTSMTLYRFTRCTLTYSANSGYKFVNWSQNGSAFGTSTQNQQWVVGTSASYALSATFAPIVPDGTYLGGEAWGWSYPNIKTMHTNPSESAEQMISGLALEANSGVKVVCFTNDQEAWHGANSVSVDTEASSAGYSASGTGSSNTSMNKGGIYNIYVNTTSWNYHFMPLRINYDANGGSNTMSPTFASSSGSATVSANTFTKSGNQFVEWNTQANGQGTSYDADDVISSFITSGENVTLYAQWEAVAQTYTVNYLANTTDTVTDMPSADTGVPAGPHTLSSQTPSRANYAFVGWNTNSSATTGMSSVTITNSDVNVYAIWREFNPHNGRWIEFSTKGSPSQVDRIAMDYSNNEWSADAQLYEGDEFKIVYYGSEVKSDERGFTDLQPGAQGFGQIVVGTTDAMKVNVHDSSKTSNDVYSGTYHITFNDSYMEFKSFIQKIQYTVTYHANNGTAEADRAVHPEVGSKFTTESYTVASFTPPTNKVFKGWNTASDGSGTSYNINDQVEGSQYFNQTTNYELYAMWGDPVADGMYLRGSFDWTAQGQIHMIADESVENQYVAKGVKLENNNSVKAVGYSSNYESWIAATSAGVPSDTGYSASVDSTNAKISGGRGVFNVYVKTTDGSYNFYPLRVNYDANTGSGTAMSPSFPTNEGYLATVSANTYTAPSANMRFNGWNTAADGSGTSYSEGASVPFSSATDNITLYAQWLGQVTLTYIDGQGTRTFTGYPGDAFVAPAVRDKVGYTTVGWSNTYTIYPNQNTTVTAVYDAINYAISFNAGVGATGGSVSPSTYNISTEAQTVTITAPTKNGYTPSYTITPSVDYVGTAPTISDTTVTIPAGSYGDFSVITTWTPITPTVTIEIEGNGYVVDDEGNEVETLTVEYGDEFIFDNENGEALIGDYTIYAIGGDSTQQYNYVFKEWSIDPACESITGNATVTATFEPELRTYSLSYGGSDYTKPTSPKEGSYDYGTVIQTSPEATKANHHLEGWYTNSGLTQKVTFPYTISGDVTLYPNFILDDETITITIDGNYGVVKNGSGNVVSSIDVPYGSLVEIKSNGEIYIVGEDDFEASLIPVANDGGAQHTNSFTGWTGIADGDQITTDKNITASFSQEARKYTITFVNYDDSELQSSEVAYGSMPSYTGNTPTKPNDDTYSYTFAGWDKTIVSVEGEATYKATFTPTILPEVEARLFASKFLEEMGKVCDEDGKTEESDLAGAWETLFESTDWTELSPEAKNILKTAKPDAESTDLTEKFGASYDYICSKYKLTNVVGRDLTKSPYAVSSNNRVFSVGDVSTSTWIIAAVAVVGIAAVGVFFIYRKRKEN